MKQRLARLAATLLAAALLAGCGASTGGSVNAVADSQYAAASLEAGGAESALLPEGAATSETARKVVYRASLYLESTDFDTAKETLLAAIEANSAWLEYSHLSGDAEDHDRTLNYTVRVPVEQYTDFLAQAGQSGNLLSLDENAEDVTSNYIDLDARLTALEAQRDRLNALAGQAETTADLLEIESQLSDVQYQLESYTQQMRSLEGQITYSTVDVFLDEVASLTPTGVTFAEKLGDAFRGGWTGFVVFVQGLVLALVYLWPLLLLAVVVFLLIRVLLRRRRARHPMPPQSTPPAPPAPYTTPAPEDPQQEPKPKY